MKEKIKNYLKSEGFCPNEIDEGLVSFSYEGVNMLLMMHNLPNVTFMVPCLIEMSDTDELTFYKLIEKVNSSVKYIKCYEISEGLSLFYETEFNETDDVEEKVDELLDLMVAVTVLSKKCIDNFLNGNEDDE